jgi:hypothetical protein
MTIYYVGPGGSDTAAGTSWATRLLTLNAAEDAHAGGTPKNAIAAGDTVYIGPGTYRELLTCDVSGSAGNLITYIGDYDGSHTDGVGGIVRITASDNDSTAARSYCVTATAKDYRAFTGFALDFGVNAFLISNCDYFTVTKCHILCPSGGQGGVSIASTSTYCTVTHCYFTGVASSYGVHLTHTSVVDNSGHLINNCLFIGVGTGVFSARVGGAVVSNCIFSGMLNYAARVGTALTVGQTLTVNNCIVVCSATGFRSTTSTELAEDYNNLYGNTADRSTTGTGAHSTSYIPMFDPRWFFELVSGQGRLLTPFDLSSYSLLLNVAGTSPTATDMRGTGTIGAQREWGALEYDPTLLYRRVMGRQF